MFISLAECYGTGFVFFFPVVYFCGNATAPLTGLADLLQHFQYLNIQISLHCQKHMNVNFSRPEIAWTEFETSSLLNGFEFLLFVVLRCCVRRCTTPCVCGACVPRTRTCWWSSPGWSGWSSGSPGCDRLRASHCPRLGIRPARSTCCTPC